MNVEFGIAFAPARGERICGDSHAIIEGPEAWLLCVADGLGHGPAAAESADIACECARENPQGDLTALLRAMDARLRAHRGAAISLLQADRATGRIRFAGVGNVELRARTRTHFSPITLPGIVGRGIRKVLVLEHQLEAGDLLVLSTDGISSQMDISQSIAAGVNAFARNVIEKNHRTHDDGLCVAVLASEASK